MYVLQSMDMSTRYYSNTIKIVYQEAVTVVHACHSDSEFHDVVGEADVIAALLQYRHQTVTQALLAETVCSACTGPGRPFPYEVPT